VKRGQLIIVATPGDFTSKPRPYVVVQNDSMIANSGTLTVCPLTTRLLGTGLVRVKIEPDFVNGLNCASEIQVDRITTVKKSRVDQVLGLVGTDVMALVDRALQRCLAL
jgi:mRNA interferase MazF